MGWDNKGYSYLWSDWKRRKDRSFGIWSKRKGIEGRGKEKGSIDKEGESGEVVVGVLTAGLDAASSGA